MKKKNLIFFLPDFVYGGGGKSVTSLCKNLNKKKFDISIICLNKCHYKNQLENFCKIHEIQSKKAILAQSKISKIIKEKVNTGQDTIFISNLFYANALTAIFQKKYYNLKFIFTERTAFKELSIYFGIYDFIKKTIIKLILKLFYKRADLVVANSKVVADEIRIFSNTKTTYVYPGSFKKIIKRKTTKIKKIPTIISIGRFAEEKGFDLLISAFKNINKQKYRLQIIGSGKEKGKLIKLIKRYNLNKNIKILGYKKNVYPFLIKSDLLISTSYFEGFPNVVVEALSCGVPVISSRSHGGIYEILKNETYGDLFDNGDKNQLENKIKNFLTNPNKLINKSKKGQMDLDRFSEIKSAKKYENIFKNI